MGRFKQLRIATAMLISVLAWLAGQEPAAASTLTRSGTELTYTAAPGVANTIVISDTPFGLRIVDIPETITVQDPVLGGCYQFNSQITCPLALGITKVTVVAGDMADSVSGFGLNALLEIDGGSGSDILTGGNLDDLIKAREGEADTVTCGPGNDTADVDILDVAVFGCEQLTHSGGSRVFKIGNEIVFDGADGLDNDATIGSTGVDATKSSFRFSDSAPVTAGAGCDQAGATQVTCTSLRTAPVQVYLRDQDDTATNTLANAAGGLTTIDGGTGNDVLNGGPRQDVLIGGSGDDQLIGNGRVDELTGGSGADLIEARDSFDESAISCGGGFGDEAQVDSLPLDPVGADCELVVRSALVKADSKPNASEVVYRASPGQVNHLVIDRLSSPQDGYLRFTDSGTMSDGSPMAYTADPVGGGTLAPSCTDQSTSALCIGATPPVVIVVELGDRDDSVEVNAAPGTVRLVVHGGSGSDVISGADLDDTLYGEQGADTLRSLAGPDNLYGGDGNDYLDGAAGADTFVGGDGPLDYVSYAAEAEPVTASLDDVIGDGPDGEQDNIGPDVEGLIGGSDDDLLIGNDQNNVIIGGSGDDQMLGLGGGDALLEDAGDPNGGDDQLEGGSGPDGLIAGQGDDWLVGGSGADQMVGGKGNDLVDYSAALDGSAIHLDGAPTSGASGEGDSIATDVEDALGGQGNDDLVGNAADNVLRGGAGNDALAGNAGVDQLVGEAGDDDFDGGAGPDSFAGGDGADEVSYATRPDDVMASLDGQPNDGAAGEGDSIDSDIEVLRGGSGDDGLSGNDAANSLIGGDGNDALSAAGGVDFIDAGDGDDLLAGGAGNDNLRSGAGNDQANGDDGQDTVAGEAGEDTVTGGSGSDIINGGSGNDGLNGRDGLFDVISCGTGSDATDVDGIDQLGADCDPDTVIVSAASISSTSLRLSKGKLTVKLRCRATGAKCEGKLSIASNGRVRTSKARRKKLKLGERSFSIASGQQASLAVPVAKAARKALAATGRMSVVASLRLADDGKTLARTLTVTAAKKKGKR